MTKRKPGDLISFFNTNKDIRKSISRILEEQSSLNSTLGVDTEGTDYERETKEKIAELDRKIIQLDPHFFPNEDIFSE